MLSKSNRLRKKKDLEKIFKKGQGFKEDFLYLKIRENNLKNSRFGFIVPKKIFQKAVLRNKIKRILRELVRIKLPRIKKGIDGAITILPGFEIKDFWETETILDKLFKRAGVLENNKQKSTQ